MSTAPEPFFSWTDSYLLHSRVIDGQHRHLVHLVCELHQSVVDHESKESQVERLTSLLNFAKSHFLIEEQLLRMHQCQGYLVHKAAHEGLAYALMGLRQQIASGERELSLEYVELIKLWLVDHFTEFDLPCAEFLSEENPPVCPMPAKGSLPSRR